MQADPFRARGTAYGAIHKDNPNDARKNKPLTAKFVLLVLLCLIVPPLVFVGCFCANAYTLHYRADAAQSQMDGMVFFATTTVPALVFMIVFVGLMIAAGNHRPVKWPFLLLSLFAVAWGAGTYTGLYNYNAYSRDYYLNHDMATYPAVNPDRASAGAYFDAGFTSFTFGSRVATERAIALQNHHTYCIAPIVSTPREAPIVTPATGAFEWFAAGIDCCTPQGTNFTCGEVGNFHARSGVRWVKQEVFPFLKLASQEWGAHFNMPVGVRVIFLTWVQDPWYAVEALSWQVEVNRTTYTYMFAMLNTAVVLAAAWYFWKMEPPAYQWTPKMDLEAHDKRTTSSI
mmetsp:Transcript_2559/g.5972  ORF Transcript_2559/g.5972 Transcript_2559/m.5972 type:complete len:343 (+) Transcript_2559:162-1190(+)